MEGSEEVRLRILEDEAVGAVEVEVERMMDSDDAGARSSAQAAPIDDALAIAQRTMVTDCRLKLINLFSMKTNMLVPYRLPEIRHHLF
jgi:hypothetical protein